MKNYTLCSKTPLADRVCAIMAAEIGGFNSIEPLIAGAELDVPILDCDGMGRAFPELQVGLCNMQHNTVLIVIFQQEVADFNTSMALF